MVIKFDKTQRILFFIVAVGCCVFVDYGTWYAHGRKDRKLA